MGGRSWRVFLFGGCWKQRWQFRLSNACAESGSPPGGSGGAGLGRPTVVPHHHPWGAAPPRSALLLPHRSGVSGDLRVPGGGGIPPVNQRGTPGRGAPFPPSSDPHHPPTPPPAAPGLCPPRRPRALRGAGGGREGAGDNQMLSLTPGKGGGEKKKNRCEKLVLDGHKMLISFPSFIPTNTCHRGPAVKGKRSPDGRYSCRLPGRRSGAARAPRPLRSA